MKYLKEYWRIIKLYYPAIKFLRKLSIYLMATSIISIFVLKLSNQDMINNVLISTIICLLLDVAACLTAAKLLFYKVKKQTRKLLDQKLPNDWRVKSFEFDCEGMFSWDVEKINKLKK